MVIVRHLELPAEVNLFNLVSYFGSLFGKLNFDKERLLSFDLKFSINCFDDFYCFICTSL